MYVKKLWLILLFFLLVGQIVFATTTQWYPLAPGLTYTQIFSPVSIFHRSIYAFKIDLRKYKLDLVLTKDKSGSIADIKKIVQDHQALIGINGGFFNPNLNPLGLRIKQGKQISPLKATHWWGVFFIRNNTAKIVSQRDFRASKKISFAIQSGPRLLIHGKIPSLKSGWAYRSALCLTRDGNLIIAITARLPITTSQFAKVLGKPIIKGGLGCVNAINLDGGSSSQLYAKINHFRLDIPSFAPVSDVILVLPKKVD